MPSTITGSDILTPQINVDNGTLFVDPSTGNIGVNTTNPVETFHVFGGSGARIESTAGNNAGLRLKSGSDSEWSLIASKNNNIFRIFDQTNAVDRVNIEDDDIKFINRSGNINAEIRNDSIYEQGKRLSQKVDRRAVGSSFDLNSLGENLDDYGFYGWSGSTPANAPDSFSILLHLKDANQRVQIVWGSSSSGRVYVRRADSGNYYSWTRI